MCIFVCCSVRYAAVFTAALVLYRIGVDYWNMLPHVTQYCVWYHFISISVMYGVTFCQLIFCMVSFRVDQYSVWCSHCRCIWLMLLCCDVHILDTVHWMFIVFLCNSDKSSTVCTVSLCSIIIDPLKGEAVNWSHFVTLFLTFWALWRSALSARVPECQKFKMQVRPGQHWTLVNVTFWHHCTLKG